MRYPKQSPQIIWAFMELSNIGRCFIAASWRSLGSVWAESTRQLSDSISVLITVSQDSFLTFTAELFSLPVLDVVLTLLLSHCCDVMTFVDAVEDDEEELGDISFVVGCNFISVIEWMLPLLLVGADAILNLSVIADDGIADVLLLLWLFACAICLYDVLEFAMLPVFVVVEDAVESLFAVSVVVVGELVTGSGTGDIILCHGFDFGLMFAKQSDTFKLDL